MDTSVRRNSVLHRARQQGMEGRTGSHQPVIKTAKCGRESRPGSPDIQFLNRQTVTGGNLVMTALCASLMYRLLEGLVHRSS